MLDILSSLSSENVELVGQTNYIFKDENKLNEWYLPNKLHFREKVIEKIKQSIVGIHSQKPKYKRIVITGPDGSGKISIVKDIARWIENYKTRYAYIDCTLIENTLQLIQKISKQLRFQPSKTNNDVTDFLQSVRYQIKSKHYNIFLILDNIDYLLSNEKIIIEDLCHIFNELQDIPDNFVICFTMDNDSWTNLGITIKRRLSVGHSSRIVSLKQYSMHQIFTILLSRSQEALLSNTLNKETLRIIIENCNYNLKNAFQTLLDGGFEAESQNSDKIHPKHIRELRKEDNFSELLYFLEDRKTPELFFLLMLSKYLNINNLTSINYNLVFELYNEFALKFNQPQMTKRTISRYIQKFEDQTLVCRYYSQLKFVKQKQISIMKYPATVFEMIIVKILEKRNTIFASLYPDMERTLVNQPN